MRFNAATGTLRQAAGALFGVFLFAGAVPAHESKPPAKYGGYVLEAEEIFFEIVIRPSKMLLYVKEDGKHVATGAMSGEVGFELNGVRKTAELRSGGFNLMHAELMTPPRGTPLEVKINNGRQKIFFTYVVR